MTARRLKVVLTSKLPDPVETRMCELFQTELYLHDGTMPRDVLAAALGRAEVLVTTLNDKIDAEILSAAGPELKMIANYGVGVDHIDVEAAVGRGLIVTNTPGVLTEDTAEMTLGLILAVSRRIVEGAGIVQRGEFSHWSPTWMLGRRLFGKRLGIVGMGRIGQALARRARAFGLSVHYHNRKRVSERI
ncbi:MAG: NAD(P)-dependent oxidoreductase, partial [Asticcacaulis sp.]